MGNREFCIKVCESKSRAEARFLSRQLIHCRLYVPPTRLITRYIVPAKAEPHTLPRDYISMHSVGWQYSGILTSELKGCIDYLLVYI